MSYTVEHPMNREEVEALLHELMPSKTYLWYSNGWYVPRSKNENGSKTRKPYTPLVEVTKSQPISFENTEGTLAGFWTPDYARQYW